MSKVYEKDPNAILDYVNDWSDWLISDTIVTSSWIVPSGITKDDEAQSTTTATIWLSGGTVNTDYSVVNRIVTTAGRTEDRTITIRVRQR